MEITPEIRAIAIEWAARRCECTGENCRHHLRGTRCKRGLRDDQWKVYWRSENGGPTRANIEAWCLDCFDNNFEVPRETIALLTIDIADFPRLSEENERRATTLKSLLRDAANRAADACRGRVVLDRLDDDLLMEFSTSRAAVDGVRTVGSGFEEIANRLDLTVPHLCGAIHCGEVTRWRNGMLVGDAVDLANSLKRIAGLGQVVLTEPAAEPIRGCVELEPVPASATSVLSLDGALWAISL